MGVGDDDIDDDQVGLDVDGGSVEARVQACASARRERKESSKEAAGNAVASARPPDLEPKITRGCLRISLSSRVVAKGSPLSVNRRPETQNGRPKGAAVLLAASENYFRARSSS